MKISVIIPAFNAEATIRPCLESILASDYPRRDFEIMVVDDNSRDQTPGILQDYPCQSMRLDKTSGAAHARNAGAQKAVGELLVFIDADVGIRTDTLTMIARVFEKESHLTALTGILAKTCVFTDFFSQYKNLYMHHIFRRAGTDTDFLYGSLIAVRRRDFFPFDESYRMTDDTELGQRYQSRGYRIRLERGLEIEHMKQYSAWSLVRNDFRVPFWWAKTFWRYGGFPKVWRKRCFAHARVDQLASIACVYFVLVNFLTGWWPGLFGGLLVWGGLNAHFLSFLNRERGSSFFLRAVGVTFFDQIVMGAGALSGLIFFFFTKSSKRDQVGHAG